MTEIISVKFKDTGKSYYFSPGSYKFTKGQAVIVETSKGIEYALCTEGNKEIDENTLVRPLSPIIRPATKQDELKQSENLRLAEKALDICRDKIEYHKLDMRLVSAEYTFDRAKLTFCYTAPERVDFRELVKTLAITFKTRIELRQINIREKARIIGGLGICGLPLCCKRHITDFQTVSIKLAKEQNLLLSLPKISGSCGKLMCCLKYEQDTYSHLLSITPKKGAYVSTPEGKGTVVDNNLLTGILKISLEKSPNTSPVKYHRKEITLIKDSKITVNSEEIKELGEAEDKN